MYVGIFAQELNGEKAGYLHTLMAALEEHEIAYSVYKPLYLNSPDLFEEAPAVFEDGKDLEQSGAEALISLGGDGSILKAVWILDRSDIPILGINLGRMGFLAIIEKSKIQAAVKQLANGEYEIARRSMLSLQTEEDLFEGKPFALNDFTLHKRDDSSMVTIHTYIDGKHLNSYWADGLVVATPTGSTGYSLACGGPIVFPGSGNFVITAVAAHNLNVRPIVISDSSEIKFKIEGRADSYLATLDSRSIAISAEQELHLKKLGFSCPLIKPHHSSYMQTLQNKLNWGKDVRNR